MFFFHFNAYVTLNCHYMTSHIIRKTFLEIPIFNQVPVEILTALKHSQVAIKKSELKKVIP